jgi:hypothetical protein
MALHEARRLDEAEAMVGEIVRAVSPQWVFASRVWLEAGLVALAKGELAEAERLARLACDAEGELYAFLALVLVRRGRVDEALAALPDEPFVRRAALGFTAGTSLALIAQIEIFAAAGRPEARAHAAQAAAIVRAKADAIDDPALRGPFLAAPNPARILLLAAQLNG